MLRVYGFSRVNKIARGNTRDLRVLWALEEMGLPYEIVGLDHPNHDLDSAEFRAMNPFGQLPVIDDGGVVVTESGAILLYLARRCGKLIPPDLAGEAQVLRWSFAALSSVELPVMAHWYVGLCGGKGAAPHDALRQWSEMRLKQLDGWLSNRAFIATDEFTVADILITHVLTAASTDQALLAPHEHLRAYLARCIERPAWKRTLDAYLARVEGVLSINSVRSECGGFAPRRPLLAGARHPRDPARAPISLKHAIFLTSGATGIDTDEWV